MSTGITTQGGTDRLDRIWTLYHSALSRNVSVVSRPLHALRVLSAPPWNEWEVVPQLCAPANPIVPFTSLTVRHKKDNKNKTPLRRPRERVLRSNFRVQRRARKWNAQRDALIVCQA